MSERTRANDTPEESLRRGHERRDLRPGALAAGLLALAVLTAAAAWAMVALLTVLQARHADRAAAPAPLIETDVLPPQPRLEPTPGEVLQRLRATEEALLHGYAWLDRDRGIARIPIERAMQILAERGLPARAATQEDGGGARDAGSRSAEAR